MGTENKEATSVFVRQKNSTGEDVKKSSRSKQKAFTIGRIRGVVLGEKTYFMCEDVPFTNLPVYNEYNQDIKLSDRVCEEFEIDPSQKTVHVYEKERLKTLLSEIYPRVYKNENNGNFQPTPEGIRTLLDFYRLYIELFGYLPLHPSVTRDTERLFRIILMCIYAHQNDVENTRKIDEFIRKMGKDKGFFTAQDELMLSKNLRSSDQPLWAYVVQMICRSYELICRNRTEIFKIFADFENTYRSTIEKPYQPCEIEEGFVRSVVGSLDIPGDYNYSVYVCISNGKNDAPPHVHVTRYSKPKDDVEYEWDLRFSLVDGGVFPFEEWRCEPGEIEKVCLALHNLMHKIQPYGYQSKFEYLTGYERSLQIGWNKEVARKLTSNPIPNFFPTHVTKTTQSGQ